MITYKEWLEQRTFLNEMAVDRKKAEQVLNSLSDEIFEHLIKILYWIDDLNFDKHCKDINTWLYKCQDILLKPNSKRLTEKNYYEWLYEEFNSSESQLSSTIKRRLKDYHSLPRTELTKNDLYIKLKNIYKEISKDLSLDKFEDIKEYI